MTDIRALLQTTLDGALYSSGVNSYWGERKDITANEYAVYTVGRDSNPDWADNLPASRETYCIVKLYYLKTLTGTSSGRTSIKVHETAIRSALIGAGFSVSSFDDNDPEDTYASIVFEVQRGECV